MREEGQGSRRREYPSPEPTSKLRKLSDRTSKACTKCRSQKMRCIGSENPPCQRCRVTNSHCEFVPRSNASVKHVLLSQPQPSSLTCTDQWRFKISNRVEELEAKNETLEKMIRELVCDRVTDDVSSPRETSNGKQTDSKHGMEPSNSSPLEGFLQDETPIDNVVVSGPCREPSKGMLAAITALRALLPQQLAEQDAWEEGHVEILWSSFRNNMPGLHFLTDTVSFTDPSLLLAASILVVSSAHHPLRQLASFQPVYFQAFAHAVGVSAIPNLAGPNHHHSSRAEAKSGSRFDDVLGIILASLLAIGWVDTVGVWIAIGYRMLLDGVAETESVRSREWKGLWEGLRTIELEHSSLHLNLPALPAIPPFSMTSSDKSNNTPASSIGELLQIMQRRLPVFVRRGFTTLWEAVCSAGLKSALSRPPPKVTESDIKEVSDWAEEIDEWRQRHTRAFNKRATSFSRTITLLNYHLHKIFVLSILLPPRGVNGVSAEEKNALLASSRIVLQIEMGGFEVWSSWDLVVITNASLILLSSLVTGAGNPQDVHLVQNHLNVLASTAQSGPSLRHTLHHRLEQALQTVRTPVVSFSTLPMATASAEPGVSTSVIHTSQPHNINGQIIMQLSTRESETIVPPLSNAILTFDASPMLSQEPMIQSTDWLFEKALDLDHAFSPHQTSDPSTHIADIEAAAEAVDFEWPPFLLNLFEQTDWSSINLNVNQNVV